MGGGCLLRALEAACCVLLNLIHFILEDKLKICFSPSSSHLDGTIKGDNCGLALGSRPGNFFFFSNTTASGSSITATLCFLGAGSTTQPEVKTFTGACYAAGITVRQTWECVRGGGVQKALYLLTLITLWLSVFPLHTIPQPLQTNLIPPEFIAALEL